MDVSYLSLKLVLDLTTFILSDFPTLSSSVDRHSCFLQTEALVKQTWYILAFVTAPYAYTEWCNIHGSNAVFVSAPRVELRENCCWENLPHSAHFGVCWMRNHTHKQWHTAQRKQTGRQKEKERKTGPRRKSNTFQQHSTHSTRIRHTAIGKGRTPLFLENINNREGNAYLFWFSLVRLSLFCHLSFLIHSVFLFVVVDSADRQEWERHE